MDNGDSPRAPAARRNSRVLRTLLVGAVAMFGFAWLMIPIYRSICSATAAYSLTRPDELLDKFAKNTQVDRSRLVPGEFDANDRGRWKLHPESRSIQVHPGELATVGFSLTNDDSRAVTGQAIPSYAPLVSGRYFRKIECFCFNQQTLAAHQTRYYPVVFVIDPELPKDVNTIILSYTFFDVAGPTPPPSAQADPVPAGVRTVEIRGS